MFVMWENINSEDDVAGESTVRTTATATSISRYAKRMQLDGERVGLVGAVVLIHKQLRIEARSVWVLLEVWGACGGEGEDGCYRYCQVRGSEAPSSFDDLVRTSVTRRGLWTAKP